MSELVGQVRAALAERRVDPAARPDLFCTPFRPESGPLSDCIIKSYRGGRDPEVLELVARRHQTYIDCLDRAGLAVAGKAAAPAAPAATTADWMKVRRFTPGVDRSGTLVIMDPSARCPIRSSLTARMS